MNRISELINEGMKNPIKEPRMHLERHDWNMIALQESYNSINSINISEERMYPQKEGGLP